jgi:hypothetical protein
MHTTPASGFTGRLYPVEVAALPSELASSRDVRSGCRSGPYNLTSFTHDISCELSGGGIAPGGLIFGTDVSSPSPCFIQKTFLRLPSLRPMNRLVAMERSPSDLIPEMGACALYATACADTGGTMSCDPKDL